MPKNWINMVPIQIFTGVGFKRPPFFRSILVAPSGRVKNFDATKIPEKSVVHPDNIISDTSFQTQYL